MKELIREFFREYHRPTRDDLEEFCAVREIDSELFIAALRRVLLRKAERTMRKASRALQKAKRAPIGATSVDGKRKKIAEGKWVPLPKGEKLPKRISEKARPVPPSWTDIQYFDDPDAKLLVKGKDEKGRMQYIYNSSHVTASAKEKFARINALNESFDSIAAENEKNVKVRSEPAMCLALIMSTGIRPGSEKETAAETEAFGATTLQGKHVKVGKDGVRLEFTGKKGVSQSISVEDAEIASMLKRLKRKAGNDGRLFGITGDQLLKYTKSLGGSAGFQSKDFRTHLGTETAMKAMEKYSPKTTKEYKKAVREVADTVAEKLGNTRKVALSSYINPAIFEEWRRNVE